MKIHVSLSIDVDPALWAEYNGFVFNTTTERNRLVRNDVRSHTLNHVHGSEIIAESNGTVTLRNTK